MDFEAEAKAIIDKILYGAGFDFDEFTADALRRAYEAGVADALVKRIDAIAGDDWAPVTQEGA